MSGGTRKIVLRMMTTLDGRLDDPMAWLHGVSDAGLGLQLLASSTYENGVVGLHYAPRQLAEEVRRESFTDMLT